MASIDFKEQLLKGLGGPWPAPCDLKPQVLESTQKEGYRLEKVTFEAEPGDPIPAYVLIPDGVTASNPAPAVAVWHQHNGAWGLGKVEPAGLAGSPMHHTGVALAKLGYVTICPDSLTFGERQDPTKKLVGGNYERFEFLRYLVAGKCLAWKDILDMRRTLDYLVTRPEVEASSIGCYGHSMGSTHAYMVGPWDERLKCVVCNCCLPTYKAIHREHMLHCFPNYVPGIFQHGDTPDIVALIAPRALHMNFGETDGGSPIDEVRNGLKIIGNAYSAIHADDKFSYFIEPGVGHVLSEEMWKRTVAVFNKHLRAA
jgi:dienelactone hydrolase